MFQKFYEFDGSSIFYKMRENFPFMRVSVRMRETWKACDMCPHHILIWYQANKSWAMEFHVLFTVIF